MDGGSVARIADLAVVTREMPILEVGPGTGALTRALAARSERLIALEVDADLIELLREDKELARVEILHADALSFPYDEFLSGQAWSATGNLPYNIATPLLMRWIEALNPPERITVMLQSDVADRLIAQAGTPAYGSLSVATQLIMEARRAFRLGPNLFYPPPKVDSTVVVLERRAEPLVSGTLLNRTRVLARAAFAYRRKTLVNSLQLALGIERARIRAALRGLGLEMEIRGEQLDLKEFVALAEALS